jgi:hypothetical protein
LYNAKADRDVIILYVIGGVIIVYFGMNIAAAFDNRAAMTGSLPCYFFGLLCWGTVCSGLYYLYGDLQTANNSGAFMACHIWLAVVIYACRIFATEILRILWL